MENKLKKEVQTCLYCSSQNSKENKFCTNCGKELTTDQPSKETLESSQYVPMEDSQQKLKNPKFNIITILGIIVVIPWLLNPLFLIVSIIVLLLYIKKPSIRKFIVFFLTGLGELAIGGVVIVLILFGACFLMINS